MENRGPLNWLGADPFQSVKAAVNWNLASDPVRQFLGGFNQADVMILGVVPDWQGVKLFQIGAGIGNYTVSLGLRTDFQSASAYLNVSHRIGGNESISGSYNFGDNSLSASTKIAATPGPWPTPFVSRDSTGTFWLGGQLAAKNVIRLESSISIVPGTYSGDSGFSDRPWVTLNPTTFAPDAAGVTRYNTNSGTASGTVVTSKGAQTFSVGVDARQRAEGLVNPRWVTDVKSVSAFQRTEDSGPGTGFFWRSVNYLYDTFYKSWMETSPRPSERSGSTSETDESATLPKATTKGRSSRPYRTQPTPMPKRRAAITSLP